MAIPSRSHPNWLGLLQSRLSFMPAKHLSSSQTSLENKSDFLLMLSASPLWCSLPLLILCTALPNLHTVIWFGPSISLACHSFARLLLSRPLFLFFGGFCRVLEFFSARILSWKMFADVKIAGRCLSPSLLSSYVMTPLKGNTHRGEGVCIHLGQLATSR